jgi:hypothetical protein
MQKQKKKLKYKFYKNKKYRSFKNLIKFNKTFYPSKNNLTKIIFLNKNIHIKQKIYIKLLPNNVFCNYAVDNKTLVFISAGLCNLSISKKTLKTRYKLVFENFLEKIQDMLVYKNILISLTCPIKYKKQIINQFLFNNKFKKHKLIFNIESKKCFNGCRPKKKKRSKRKGLRLFK